VRGGEAEGGVEGLEEGEKSSRGPSLHATLAFNVKL
jgi:hypothetical protein